MTKPGTKLTLEQRARRATTRRNRKAAKLYPLFPDHFATTVEAETARIQRQEAQGRAFIARLVARGNQSYQLGLDRRDIAVAHAPAACIEENEAAFQRIHGHNLPDHAWRVGAYLADRWWHVLRDHASAHIVRPLCPSADRHAAAAPGATCPTCRTKEPDHVPQD